MRYCSTWRRYVRRTSTYKLITYYLWSWPHDHIPCRWTGPSERSTSQPTSKVQFPRPPLQKYLSHSQKRAKSCRKHTVCRVPSKLECKFVHLWCTGKINFYVINQAKVDTVPADELAALEAECKALEEGNTALIGRVKQLTTGFHQSIRSLLSGIVLIPSHRAHED